MSAILQAENISKQYRLGLVGTGTLSHDLNRFWHQLRGKPDPYLQIGMENDRSQKAEADYVWALRCIDFEVQPGEVLGIIGKNGAGKSTLLKILSRVTAPTTGIIRSRGRIASLLEVGTGFHPELTGRENIYLNGAILGMTKVEIKAKEEEIIDFSGCAMYIDTPVKRYSSGMRVRLGFAVAAHLEPDILVVDEVLAVGDVEFQKKAIGKMQDISGSEGRTVLFVSHNMAAVKSLCTRAIVLENGKAAFEGSAEESVDWYLSSSNDNGVNLEKRTDRKGSQDFFVTHIEMLNKKNKSVKEVISGEYLKIRFHIEFNNPKFVNDVFFGVALLNNQEQKVSAFLSDEMGESVFISNKTRYLDLEIPKLYLRSAVYNISFQFGKNKSTQEKDYIDVVENANQIYILPGDIWSSGIINRRGEYAVFPGKMSIW
ncbi:MAG: ABC transporter ATP-binding protein [Flavobacteriaceae bacterium]|nr:ABC transporter ATP-binding protein [Flavobacteriaceae bacterium]